MPVFLARSAVPLHWVAAVKQPAQGTVRLPLRALLPAPRTGGYERDGCRVIPIDLNRGHFTISFLGTRFVLFTALQGALTLRQILQANNVSFGH